MPALRRSGTGPARSRGESSVPVHIARTRAPGARSGGRGPPRSSCTRRIVRAVPSRTASTAVVLPRGVHTGQGHVRAERLEQLRKLVLSHVEVAALVVVELVGERAVGVGGGRHDDVHLPFRARVSATYQIRRSSSSAVSSPRNTLSARSSARASAAWPAFGGPPSSRMT